MADPGRHLNGDIISENIILRIAGRSIFAMTAELHKGNQVQRSYNDEGDGP
jgi:hypothetical protein